MYNFIIFYSLAVLFLFSLFVFLILQSYSYVKPKIIIEKKRKLLKNSRFQKNEIIPYFNNLNKSSFYKTVRFLMKENGFKIKKNYFEKNEYKIIKSKYNEFYICIKQNNDFINKEDLDSFFFFLTNKNKKGVFVSSGKRSEDILNLNYDNIEIISESKLISLFAGDNIKIFGHKYKK